MTNVLKALKRHEAHLPVNTFEGLCDPDDAFYTLDIIKSVRKVKGGAVKVSMIDGDSMWFYRGREIHFDPSSYVYPWHVGGHYTGRSFSTISDAVDYIEQGTRR